MGLRSPDCGGVSHLRPAGGRPRDHPRGRGTTRLARLIGQTKCMEMILDGRPITAQEALSLGAINRVVPDDRLREEAIAWAAHIARWPAWSLAACKRSLVEGRDARSRGPSQRRADLR